MTAPTLSVKAVFDHAQEITSPTLRKAYLEDACADAPELRLKVEALLSAYDDARSFLASPPGLAATADYTPKEGPGSRIGPYRLLQQIGEGGMGIVYMAEQEHPVRRTVALKIIKPGLDSQQVIARFESERQALAMMDHLHIAKVFDAGTTDTGRPFFAMELVKGVPFTKFCDDHHLTPRERLELFIPVCQAVQHAHQKGIIHRDLKPSNVLVALYDDKPVPKVIDFGVAKAIGQRLTERTMFTEYGMIVGTLEYMSPEQAKFNALDIDTRSDIYALGVMLYELLTGSTPFERKRLRQAALEELVRILCDEEPPKPSTRLSDSGEALASISAQRRTEPALLPKLVRGDLDWIVMKALEKDRVRRYESAAGFARDIQRYLSDEVVEACPPSTGYRLRKWLWRHRVGAIFAVTVWLLTLMLMGFAALHYMMAVDSRRLAEMERARSMEAEQRAHEERDRAMLERLRAEQAEQQAAQEAAAAKAVSDFLQRDLLGQADSREQSKRGQPTDPHLTVKEALNRAADRVGEGFRKQPLQEATIRQTIGDAYRGIGEAAAGLLHLERAVALREAHLGPDHSDTLESMNNLAAAYKHANRLPDSIKVYEETLKRLRRRFGQDHTATLAAMSGLGTAYQSAGRVQEAIPLYEQSLRLAKHRLSPEHPVTLSAMHNLGTAYRDVKRLPEAIALFEESLRLMKVKHGPEDPQTIVVRHYLALAYEDSGRHAEALNLLTDTVRLARTKLTTDHPDTLKAMSNLAGMLLRAHRGQEAVPLLEEVVKSAPKQLGPDDKHTFDALFRLAWIYDEAGKLKEAEQLFTQFLASARRRFGPEHWEVAGGQAQLGRTLLRQKKYSEAEVLLRASLAFRAKHHPENWMTSNTRSLLGAVFLGQKKYREAEPLLLQGYEGMKQQAAKIPPAGKPRFREAVEYLVQLYSAMGKQAEADHWRKVLERMPKANHTSGDG